MTVKRLLANSANKLLNAFGYEIRRRGQDFYLHEYSSYNEYKETQVAHNKRKINNVWADACTLDVVVARVEKEFAGRECIVALCHGTRNGFEQNYIASKLDVDITGTDISETANSFPRSVQWDFHDIKEEWIGSCDFIYTNSLDQSWKPQSALSTWINQLREGGLLFVEHTEAHGAQDAGEMDPFGASPQYMPYLICDWFGHHISIEIIKSVKSNNDMNVWIFVIKKNRPNPGT